MAVLKHITTYAAPEGRERWIFKLEISPGRGGRWFEVNLLDDISTPELEELFVGVQEMLAEKQGDRERRRELERKITDSAGVALPPKKED